MASSSVPDRMVFREHPRGRGDIDIERMVRDQWVPWVLVRDSAAMARLGMRGKGLYAARAFSSGDVIGRYVGRLLGRANDPTIAARVERLSRTPGGDALVTINGFAVNGRKAVQADAAQLADFGKVVFGRDKWPWPGAHIHIANDAHGTTLPNNSVVTPGGYAKAIRDVPAFAPQRTVASNVASELLWSYGEQYWAETSRLGSREVPIVIDSDSD
jgi:hypothetical protein